MVAVEVSQSVVIGDGVVAVAVPTKTEANDRIDFGCGIHGLQVHPYSVDYGQVSPDSKNVSPNTFATSMT